MDLSVITATHKRPEFLSHCLDQFRRQSLGGLLVEHIVVSDGPDEYAKYLANQAGARYFELPESVGQWGAGAKDRGIIEVRGRYVCFWDDDNIYESHALVALFAAVQNAEIGVVRTEHRFRRRPGFITIPRRWNGRFELGDIDTMCVCVQTELARREKWQLENPTISNDHTWLMNLMKYNPRINYLPITIGKHL